MLATATVVVSVALRTQTQETCISSEIHMVCMGENVSLVEKSIPSDTAICGEAHIPRDTCVKNKLPRETRITKTLGLLDKNQSCECMKFANFVQVCSIITAADPGCIHRRSWG